MAHLVCWWYVHANLDLFDVCICQQVRDCLQLLAAEVAQPVSNTAQLILCRQQAVGIDDEQWRPVANSRCC
jgi:hypothetical protein